MKSDISLPLAQEEISDTSQGLTLKNRTNNMISIKRKRQIFLIIITSTIIFSLIGGLYFFFYSYQLQNQKPETLSMILNVQTKIQNVEGVLIIDGIPASQIQTLTIDNSQMTHFDTSGYENLKNIRLGENLKLQSLIINNSIIVDFSYNSTELLYLTLVNNKNMTSFRNSVLPRLQNLTVISTNIKTWQSNTFGNLSSFIIEQSQALFIPLLDIKITTLSLYKCSVSTNTDLSQFIHLQNVEMTSLFSTNSYPSLLISNISMKSFSLKSSVLYSVQIKDCRQLTQLAFNYNNINQIVIKNSNNINPCTFSINQRQLQFLSIQDYFLQEFNIQTQQLNQLYLLGTQLKKIQYKIPGLNLLQLKKTKINSAQFAKIESNSLQTLRMIENNNITQITNSFINLKYIKLINQLSSLDKLVAQNLQQVLIQDINSGTASISGKFPQLSIINIIKSKIGTLSIGSQINTYLQIINSESTIANNKIALYLQDKKQLQRLNISNSKVNLIGPTSLPSLCSIDIINSDFAISGINLSCSKKDFYFKVYSATNLTAGNNTISAAGAWIFDKTKMSKFNQSLPYAENVQLNENQIKLITSFLKLIPNVKNLTVTNNSDLRNITSASLSYLKNLTVLNPRKTYFKLIKNQFPNLVYLHIQTSNSTPLVSNHFPLLEDLSIQGHLSTTNFTSTLNEFKHWKDNGTSLKRIHINVSDTRHNEINSIWPGIQFY